MKQIIWRQNDRSEGFGRGRSLVADRAPQRTSRALCPPFGSAAMHHSLRGIKKLRPGATPRYEDGGGGAPDEQFEGFAQSLAIIHIARDGDSRPARG